MKHLLCSLTLSILAIASFGEAHAAKDKMTFETRADLVSTDRDFSKTGKRSNAAFQMNRARVNLRGQIFDDLSYRFRLNLLGLGNGAGTGIDKSNSALDYAYITKKFNDSFAMSLGKIIPFPGTHEGQFGGHHQYLYSHIAGTWQGFKTGARVQYTTAGQTFFLHAFNSDENKDANGNFVQSHYSYNFSYYGNFAGGMIQPIVGYYHKPYSYRGNFSYLDLGVKFQLPKMWFYLDYGMHKTERSSTSGTPGVLADGKDTIDTSIVFEYQYTGEHFRPRAKIIMDNREFNSTDVYDRMGFALALEYYPVPKASVNYHLAYTSMETEPKGATATTETNILLGFTADWTAFQVN